MTDREKYIHDLEQLIQLWKDNPEFDVYYRGHTTFCSFPKSKEAFIAQCKVMGSFEKKWGDDTLQAVKTFPSGITLHVFRDRDEFCKRVVKKVEVPATEEKHYEAVTIPAKPAHTKEEVTWECPEDLSLIGG